MVLTAEERKRRATIRAIMRDIARQITSLPTADQLVIESKLLDLLSKLERRNAEVIQAPNPGPMIWF